MIPIPRSTLHYRANRELERILSMQSDSDNESLQSEQVDLHCNAGEQMYRSGSADNGLYDDENSVDVQEDVDAGSVDNGIYNGLLYQEVQEGIVPMDPPSPAPSSSGDSSSGDSDLSDSESDSDTDAPLNLRPQLAHWARHYNSIPHVAINGLLNILRTVDDTLPKDARALLRTPRTENVNILNVSGGQYYHFGLHHGLCLFLQKNVTINAGTTLKLQIGIDGVPLHKSTSKQFWPILCKVTGRYDAFLIGLFFSNSKPTDLEWLNSFIVEVNRVCGADLVYNGGNFKVRIDCFICDAPARSGIKCVKSHSGYYGCERCDQEGEYLGGSVVFPEIHCALRTDEGFREMRYEDHILARFSPFTTSGYTEHRNGDIFCNRQYVFNIPGRG